MYVQIAIREAKRQNLAYREHSIQALSRYAAARDDKDLSDVVLGVVGPILEDMCRNQESNGDEMDVDVDDSTNAEDDRR